MTVTEAPPSPPVDERLATSRLLDRLVVRPEVGAGLGAVAVFVFFAVFTEQFLSVAGVATWLDVASTLGIMAVAVALLMIGGEFDLSAGVMTASTGLVTALLATRPAGTSGWRCSCRWCSRSSSARSTACW